jgi:hypothetical protein
MCETEARRQDTQLFINTGRVTLVVTRSDGGGIGGPMRIKIEGLFQENADFDKGTKVYIKCDNLQNPLTMSETGSFSIEISNPNVA